jgi:CRISPR-associated protein Cas5d
MQLFATVLSDVCYRLHGIVVGPRWNGHINPRHYLHDLFNRRLKRGQCFRTPCLGWSEFTCSYWGPFRDGATEADTNLALEIPSMLLGVWNSPLSGQYEPKFQQNVRIAGGLLRYVVPDKWLSEPNREVNENAQ